MNNKNLNPLSDPEVAEMLTMSPEDQLWSFLDDCVPHDGKDAVLVMMGDFDVNYKNEDGNIAINEERETPGRQKVVRGSNAQAVTSHAGLNPRSKSGYEREARVINGVPYCAMITDLIFERSEKELLSMSMTKPYEKYFAIQKECYAPYFTECRILDDYNDLTEEQQDFLDELETGSIWAVSLKKPEDAVSVRVAISFVGCGRDIREEGWLIRISDSNQG